MDISFASRKLERTMESEALLNKVYGKWASAIKKRLAVLDSAACLADVPRVPPDRCHELSNDRAGTFAVDVSKNYRLVFKPNHHPVPKKADGGIDLAQVTAIEILKVEDYH